MGPSCSAHLSLFFFIGFAAAPVEHFTPARPEEATASGKEHEALHLAATAGAQDCLDSQTLQTERAAAPKGSSKCQELLNK